MFCFSAPHQPRLDWQMWFAALGNYQHNPWFLNLVYRLLTQQSEGKTHTHIHMHTHTCKCHQSPKNPAKCHQWEVDKIGEDIYIRHHIASMYFCVPVLELMGSNPFPDKPPKYIRASLYHYHFTSRDRTQERWAELHLTWSDPNLYFHHLRRVRATRKSVSA